MEDEFSTFCAHNFAPDQNLINPPTQQQRNRKNGSHSTQYISYPYEKDAYKEKGIAFVTLPFVVPLG